MDILRTNKHPNGILEIQLHRPEKYNALSQDLLQALSKTLGDAKQNHEIRAILLTGAGKAFCAGADIAQLAEADATSGLAFAETGQAICRQLETLGKPSLAAIHGVAMGGGCELAMAATMRLAGTDARFAQPEVKLGVIPGFGGTIRLAKLIGKGLALDLCITGRTIDANTALAYGLVSEVTTTEDLLPRSLQILTQLSTGPARAIQAIIETIDLGFDMNFKDAEKLEALQFANICATQDKQEGVSAYLEKRTPVFTFK